MNRRARARPDRGTRAVVLARWTMTRSRWPRSRPSSASGTARTTTSGARLRSAVALRRLKDCKSVGQPVALVLASHRMADLLGTELLGRATNSTPPPSGACSSAGVTGRQQSRCCRPWPSASSTTTCPNRRHPPTRASTRSSRASWPLAQAARPRVHTDRCTGHRHAAASTATGRGPPMRRCRRRVADPSFLS